MGERAHGVVWIVSRLAVLAVGLVVLVAGFAKAQDVGWFVGVLEEHQRLPAPLVGPAAIAVCAAEIAIGVLAVRGVLARSSRLPGVMLGMLFLAFTLYSAWMSIDPPPGPVSCGCGVSRAGAESWTMLTVRNGVIAAACAGAGCIGKASGTSWMARASDG